MRDDLTGGHLPHAYPLRSGTPGDRERFCHDPHCDCRQLTGGRPHYPPLVQTNPLQVGAAFVVESLASSQRPPLALAHASAETLRAECAAAERERIRLDLLALVKRAPLHQHSWLLGALRDFARRLEPVQGAVDQPSGGGWDRRWVRVRDGGVEIWPAPLLEPVTASAYVDGQRISATAGTPEEADAELTRAAGLDHSDLPGECPAILWHGPGHQSRARCCLRGPHVIHETVYGSARQFARWEGDKAFSGVFNEPPPEPKP